MADQRALDAISRIERALARIEAAASRPAAPAASAQDDEGYQRLHEAHATLRARVAGAIGEIDRMIANGERV